ncbi:MAG: VTT domain-containing protein [Legionellaceae bacterium]|nr:VTT domain-containing protein [Legionellaceae bacterium]
MHLFTDYVQPITTWLQANPSWGLLLTVLISCAESLAIIGSIIPGSLTMTAIGMLAGSGVMRLDLILCAASLGALAGDGISYTLGYVFSDRLTQIWPFRRYPGLLQYGKDFFLRHGGKSVLIGRFIGPLRAIIPVIAGMMHMPRLHFFFANLFSAVGWALLYVMPGYLIGIAGNQLSTDSARRLFVFIIIVLFFVWIASKGVHWLARAINRCYSAHLNAIYVWSKNHPFFKKLFRDLTDESKEQVNCSTITLVFMWLLCLIATVLITLFVLQNTWINDVNQPVSFFLQSLRTHLFDGFFIILNFIISPPSLIGVFLVISTAAIYAKDWRLLRYWISLACITFGVTSLLAFIIPVPNPASLYKMKTDATFPVIHLTWATSLFSFLICYLIEYHRNELSYLLRALLIAILTIAGFSLVYFGDNWMTSVVAAYFIGLVVSLIFWIVYQRQKTPHHHVGLAIVLSCGTLLITTGLEYYVNFQKVAIHHAQKPQQYELSEDTWWLQNKPLLPIYTTNRIGKNIGLFNIQYAGSIKHLEQRLIKSGWRKQSSPILYALMMRADGQHSAEDFPVLEQLYLNKKPILIMTFRNKKNHNLYIMRLWQSNYHISNYPEPIWLGSIILIRKKVPHFKMINHPPSSDQSMTLFTPILSAIKNYRVARMTVEDKHIKSLRYVIPPELLIMRD